MPYITHSVQVRDSYNFISLNLDSFPQLYDFISRKNIGLGLDVGKLTFKRWRTEIQCWLVLAELTRWRNDQSAKRYIKWIPAFLFDNYFRINLKFRRLRTDLERRRIDFICELVVDELPRWRNDRLPKSQKLNINRIPGYLFDNYSRLKV